MKIIRAWISGILTISAQAMKRTSTKILKKRSQMRNPKKKMDPLLSSNTTRKKKQNSILTLGSKTRRYFSTKRRLVKAKQFLLLHAELDHCMATNNSRVSSISILIVMNLGKTARAVGTQSSKISSTAAYLKT